MKKHLTECHLYYVNAHDGKIRPISEVDCEIIEQIVSILKTKNQSELAKILDKWKDDSDVKILDQLYQYALGLDDEYEDEVSGRASSKAGKTMITFKNKISLWANGIFSISKEIKKDKNGNLIPYIGINTIELPTNSNWYPDTYIEYDSVEERDGVWNKAQSVMNEIGVEFINLD